VARTEVKDDTGLHLAISKLILSRLVPGNELDGMPRMFQIVFLQAVVFFTAVAVYAFRGIKTYCFKFKLCGQRHFQGNAEVTSSYFSKVASRRNGLV